MRADMHRHNLVVLDEQFDGEPVTERDRERVQAGQPALQGMEAERGVQRVGRQDVQAFFVLGQQVGVPFRCLGCRCLGSRPTA